MKPARMTPAASRKRKAREALKRAHGVSALAYYKQKAREEMLRDLQAMELAALIGRGGPIGPAADGIGALVGSIVSAPGPVLQVAAYRLIQHR